MNHVEIECEFDHSHSTEEISSFVKLGDEMLQVRQLDQVAKKKPLTIGGYMKGTTVSFLAQMFPHVQAVLLQKNDDPSGIPYKFLSKV